MNRQKFGNVCCLPKERNDETTKNGSPRPLGEGLGVRGRKVAFTLAETIIVLVILGVVAAITIPALVNRHVEATNRTKIKKAMQVYDTALSKMVIENGLKSNDALTEWAPQNDCSKTSTYFKAVENLDGNLCKFRSADGVWWDISNIMNPIVALKDDYLNAEYAKVDGSDAAKKNKAFYLVGHFDTNGSLRTNDLQYEVNASNATEKAELEKLYAFINREEYIAQEELGTFAKCLKEEKTTCNVNGVDFTLKTIGDYEVDKVWGSDICVWDYEKNAQNCGYVSTATAGDYYFTDPVSPNDYKSYLDEESSTCQVCKDNGWSDYYNAAKRYCEANGGRLPTVAELISGGYASVGEDFWASEEDGSDGAYGLRYGSASDSHKSNEHHVVCVGND